MKTDDPSELETLNNEPHCSKKEGLHLCIMHAYRVNTTLVTLSHTGIKDTDMN